MPIYRLTADYLRARAAEGMTVAHIARHAECTREAVRQALARHKVVLQVHHPRITADVRAQIGGLAARGLCRAQIAAELGISVSTVKREAARRGIVLASAKGGPSPKPRPLTRAELMAFLTDAQRADYTILRRRALYTRDAALRSIRRADLIGATTATHPPRPRATDERLAA